MTLNNPAATELFGQVFDRFVYHLEETGLCRIDMGGLPADSVVIKLRSCVLEKGWFSDTAFIELALLKGLFDEFAYSQFDRYRLSGLMQAMIESAHDPEIPSMGMECLDEVTRLEAGKPAPGFCLENMEGKPRELTDYKGKYVYLAFVSTQSYTCLMHFPLLAEIKKTYPDQLEVVAIAVEESARALAEALDGRAYPWEFLYFDERFFILEHYKVRAYPTYFLIDPEGRLLWSPADSPAEGFEEQFQDLMQPGN
jgi:thiol-disulfide isomerase/thioredoxin